MHNIHLLLYNNANKRKYQNDLSIKLFDIHLSMIANSPSTEMYGFLIVEISA